MVRGIRNTTDWNFERSIEATNHRLFPEITTVMLVTPDEYAHISSSIVRELLSFNHDVSEFMPEGIDITNYLEN
jgi:pantetheine-phosphate adenylyltransferase